MTSEFEAGKGSDTSAKGAVESRLIFVSHTHADRDLALALKTLIESVFSGVVKPYISSDPGPAGGIMPGDEWYSQIEANLRHAEAVWVLATPASITRPWIYWESGTGRALCPHGVVVLRVGLSSAQVPSPLMNFQSYDGLSGGGISELVGKVANQIGMKLARILVEDGAKKWLEAAQEHEPLEDQAEDNPHLTPERLDRLDAAISRIEALTVPNLVRPRRPATRGRSSREEDFDPERYTTGSASSIYRSVGDFIRMIDNAPTDTFFEVTEIDGDRDALVKAHREPVTGKVYLHSSQLPELAPDTAVSERSAEVLRAIVALRDSNK